MRRSTSHVSRLSAGLLLALVLGGCSDEDEVTEQTYLGVLDPSPGAPHTAGCDEADTESNDALGLAQPVDFASCSASPKGMIAGSNDVDYFTFDFSAADSCGTPSVQATGGVRVCVFPVCPDGATVIPQKSGAGSPCHDGVPRYQSSGLVGCCADGDGERAEVLDYTCTSAPSPAFGTAYVRVDYRVVDPGCHPYTLDVTR
jgi:hypothetical protein